MKKTNFLFATLLSLIFVSCGGNNNEQPAATEANVEQTEQAAPAPVYENNYLVKVGDIAPDFTLKLTDGSDFTLSKNRGKVVMLQFTASWCGVCRKEMPFIEKDIWQKHKENPNFVLLGIDREEPLEDVKKFAESTGITYPMALDSNADVFASYAERKSGITRNILIDGEGRIVKLTRLFNETEFNSLVETIDSMLKK
ncbi:MAG: TlpA family protein disulfide reductase [Bacteroidaceae bacterium]|nr:TlpA family protein disulfide reductase [Bacteroidaceae bacterium]MBQ3153497.1 TlpA family protein disulfide reductase [Bacteroidaceae bacterium]